MFKALTVLLKYTPQMISVLTFNTKGTLLFSPKQGFICFGGIQLIVFFMWSISVLFFVIF